MQPFITLYLYPRVPCPHQKTGLGTPIGMMTILKVVKYDAKHCNGGLPGQRRIMCVLLALK